MVPPSSDPAWQKLVTGEKELRSSQLGVNMLLHSTRLRYHEDPSAANVAQLVAHLHAYFAKFEKIFQAELQQLCS